jgi:isopentenyl-diphosphate delta-isomerase
VDVGGGLREDEFNHVFVGLFSGDASPDPAEVCAWLWMTPATLGDTRAGEPHEFTPWFGVVLDRLRQWLQGKPAQLPAAVLAAWQPRP